MGDCRTAIPRLDWPQQSLPNTLHPVAFQKQVFNGLGIIAHRAIKPHLHAPLRKGFSDSQGPYQNFPTEQLHLGQDIRFSDDIPEFRSWAYLVCGAVGSGLACMIG